MLRRTGIIDRKEFSGLAELALSILEAGTIKEFSVVEKKIKAITKSISETVVTNATSVTATVANIADFLTLLCYAKSNSFGEQLSESDLRHASKIQTKLCSIMDSELQIDEPYGSAIYIVNSYLSLGTFAVSCALHSRLQTSDETMLVRVGTFIGACLFDQVTSEAIIKHDDQSIAFDYREYAKGFHIINHDNEPVGACEKLIYAFNRMIIDELLKIRFRLRTSHHLLGRLNGFLMQMNLWQLDALRTGFNEDQARFTLTCDNLETNRLQTEYVPIVSGLMGRINSARKIEQLKAYVVRAHRLVQQLFLMAMMDQRRYPHRTRETVSAIQPVIKSLLTDMQLLAAYKMKYENLSDDAEIRILERDLAFINAELSDEPKDIGQDFAACCMRGAQLSSTGLHLDIKPASVKLLSKGESEAAVAKKMVNEIEALIARVAAWQETDGDQQSKAQLVRSIKDYHIACLKHARSKTEYAAFTEPSLVKKITQLKSDASCDAIYGLLFLLIGPGETIQADQMDLYMSLITTASLRLEQASATMSSLNFTSFLDMAEIIIKTILSDNGNSFTKLKQSAQVCSQYFAKFRQTIEEERKAIITALSPESKKYQPAAAITDPHDNEVTLEDYLHLAANIMRAVTEKQLSALSDELQKIPVHPILKLDKQHEPDRLIIDTYAMYLHDLVEAIYITSRLSLQLPVESAALLRLKQHIRQFKQLATVNNKNVHLTTILQLFFLMAAHAAEVMTVSDTVTLAKNSADALFELRTVFNQIKKHKDHLTKRDKRNFYHQLAESCDVLFHVSHENDNCMEFVTQLESMLVSGILRARNRAVNEYKHLQGSTRAGNGLKSSAQQYHQLFIAATIFDNVLARFRLAVTKLGDQSERVFECGTRLLDNADASSTEIGRTVKMAPGFSLAVSRGELETRIPQTLRMIIKMTASYHLMYRSFFGADVKNLAAYRPQVVTSINLFNEYLSRQFAFLVSDITQKLQEKNKYSREVELLSVIRLFLQACHHGIERVFPEELITEILEFNIRTTKFDRYFTVDLCKAIILIISKRVDYYVMRTAEYKSKNMTSSMHNDILALMENYKSASDESKQYAARFIMEYYLRFVYLSTQAKEAQHAVALHDRVFELCKEDPLLPVFQFIYLGYSRLAALSGEINKSDIDALFPALSDITTKIPANISPLLDGLSPVLFSYFSGCARRILVGKIKIDKHFKKTQGFMSLALNELELGSHDDTNIKKFIGSICAVNHGEHLTLSADDFGLTDACHSESAYDGTSVTVNDYFALAAEILCIQNAEQAASTMAKLKLTPKKPLILLENELSACQELFNAATAKLHSMLMMLHTARRQSLNIPVSEQELDQQRQCSLELLRIPAQAGERPIIAYVLEMVILQAARVCQYFGTAPNQVNLQGIEHVLSLPRMMRLEVKIDSIPFPATASHQLCVDMINAFEAFLRPSDSSTACDIVMINLSSLIGNRLLLVRKTVEGRARMAQGMFASREMTFEQRGKLHEHVVQLSLLDVVLAALRLNVNTVDHVNYERHRAAHSLDTILSSSNAHELTTKTFPPHLSLLINEETLKDKLADIVRVSFKYLSLLQEVFKAAALYHTHNAKSYPEFNQTLAREIKRFIQDIGLLIEAAKCQLKSDFQNNINATLLDHLKIILSIYLCHLEYDLGLETKQAVVNFKFSAIPFGPHFNSTLADAYLFILYLRVSTAAPDINNKQSTQELMLTYLSELDTFITNLDGCPAASKPVAARFIMECYLLICNQGFVLKQFALAEKYRQKVFALIGKGDMRLPFYTMTHQEARILSRNHKTDEYNRLVLSALHTMCGERDLPDNLVVMFGLPHVTANLVFNILNVNQDYFKIEGYPSFEMVTQSIVLQVLISETTESAKNTVAKYLGYVNQISSSQLIALDEPVVLPVVVEEKREVSVVAADPVPVVAPVDVPANTPVVDPVEVPISIPAQSPVVVTVSTPASAPVTAPKAKPPKIVEADIEFQAVCQRFHDDDPEVCFDNIARFYTDIISSKHHSARIRACAATALAEALMYLIEGTGKTNKRESVCKMLQSYRGFINKNHAVKSDAFSNHLKRYEEYLAKQVELPVELEVSPVTQPAEEEQTIEEVQIAPETQPVANPKHDEETSSEKEPPDVYTSPEQSPPPAIIREFIDFNKGKIKLTDLTFEAVCQRWHDDNADLCFDQIAKFCSDIIHNSQHHQTLRANAALTLARALMYRIDEAVITKKRDNTYKMLQGFQSFIQTHLNKSSDEFLRCLTEFKDFQEQRAKAIKIAEAEKARKQAQMTIHNVDVSVVKYQPSVAFFVKVAQPTALSNKSVLIKHTAAAQRAVITNCKSAPTQAVKTSTPAIQTRTNSSAIIQQLAPEKPKDESLLSCRVPPVNRLVQYFQLQPSLLQNRFLDVFKTLKVDRFIFGNRVLSSLFYAKPGHLQFACLMSKEQVFNVLTSSEIQERLCIQEIVERPCKSGYLVRLDESKLQAERMQYLRSDLLIEIKCVAGSTYKEALEMFCHEERLTSMLFVDIENNCLIDVADHAPTTAVYPVKYMDRRQNVTGLLDVMRVSPDFPLSKRDNREVILDALLQLSTHHSFLGCGITLHHFIAVYKHELRDQHKKQFNLEWFNELFMNDNACHTAAWLIELDMLYDLFPQLHPDFKDDFMIACQELDKVSFNKHYTSMTPSELMTSRAYFMLNALFRSFKQSINVIDYLVEDGLDAFLVTFLSFLKNQPFEWFRKSNTAHPEHPNLKREIEDLEQAEVTSQLFWAVLLSEAIPSIHQEFFRGNTDVVYGLDDRDKFMHDITASLAEDGYPDRHWLVQQVWQYHEDQCRHAASLSVKPQ